MSLRRSEVKRNDCGNLGVKQLSGSPRHSLSFVSRDDNLDLRCGGGTVYTTLTLAFISSKVVLALRGLDC